MFRRFHGIFAAAALVALSACADQVVAPVSAGSIAPIALNETIRDDQAIVFAYQGLETIAYGLDALVATGKIAPGSPKALTLATALGSARTWLNTASRLQREGQALQASGAWEQAKAALANIRLNLEK